MIDYISLHNHTSFSIMYALTKPAELFERAKELGQDAVAVTDLASLAGMWDSLKAAKKTEIKLIAGCDYYFVDSVLTPDAPLRRMVLLAKNHTGYKNLLLLNKLGYDNFIVAFKKAVPRIDWKLLKEHSEGLICLTGCGNGILSQLVMQKKFDDAREQAKRLKDIFGDDLGIEIQANALKRRANAYTGEVDQQFINTELKKISEELDIRPVATNHSHYLNKEDHKAHDVLLAIGSGQPITSGARLTFNTAEFYVKNGLEVAQHFVRLHKFWGPEFIKKIFENTRYFADKCENAEWIDPKYSNPSGKEFPDFPVKQQSDYDDFRDWVKNHPECDNLPEDKAYLRYRCDIVFNKLVPKGREIEYRERLNEEIEVFEHCNFSSYMLIVADYLDYARNHGILLGAGRGSVGNSLVAYFLGIHKADPIAFDLVFARFLNKNRPSPPDIDVDVAPSGREKVQDYIRRKYGENKVAHVSNVNTITPKVYVRDLARTFDFGDNGRSESAKIGNQIADTIDNDIKTISAALEKAPLFAVWAEQFPQLVEYSKAISGKARAWSTHAAGLIIGSRPLADFVPVRRDVHGNVALEYDKDRVEQNGLIKMDVLGLETLDNIAKTYELIKERGKQLPSEPFDYNMYDEKTYDLICNGDVFCVFQLTGVATPVCKLLKPRSVDEIALVTALIRPSSKAVISDFMRVRSGEKPLELIHPSLNRALAKTYGFSLYEDSLLFVAADVAGWDFYTADSLRKMTKDKGKHPEKVKKLKVDFINDAEKNKNILKDIAKKIWDDIISSFSSYGFNKCLVGDTVVYRAGANDLQGPEITIEELYNAQNSNTDWGKKIRYGYLNLLQMDDDGRVRPARMKKIYYNGKREVFKVRTTDGHEIVTTTNHRLLTAVGYKHVSDLIADEDELVCMGEVSYESITSKKISIRRNLHLELAASSGYDGCGFPSGSENPGWIDGRTVVLKQAMAEVLRRAKGFCEFCGDSKSIRFEFAHIKKFDECGNSFNLYNSAENIKYLCNSCHKKLDYKKGERTKRWRKGRPTYLNKIISIEPAGYQDVYDIEMNTEQHNFIANGIVSHNSHAILYSMITFHTAYLKTHYPLEFLTANLISECNSTNAKIAKDNILKIKDEIRRLGINIVAPDLNTSHTTYKIIDDKTLMTGFDALKYMGKDAIPEILAKRPYSSFEDFLSKVDGKKVRAPAIQALAASGSLDSFGLPRKLMFFYASDFKKKLQVHLKKPENKRGEFKYPWPTEKEWSVRELFALEEYYLGEGLSGTIQERFEGFFNKGVVNFSTLPSIFPFIPLTEHEKENKRQEPVKVLRWKNTHELNVFKCVITSVFSFKVKNEDSSIFGQEMARFTLQDPWGNSSGAVAFPDGWKHINERVKQLSGGKTKLQKGLAVAFRGAFQWENEGTTSFILADILDIKNPPELPADLKAKKVKMPRASKSKKNIEELDKEELADELEDEMTEDGVSDIDEEYDELYDPFV